MTSQVKITAVVIEGKTSVVELGALIAALSPWGVRPSDIVDTDPRIEIRKVEGDAIDLMRDIQDAVASEFEIAPGQIVNRSRSTRWAKPRATFVWLAVEVGACGLAEVGRFMGTDHSAAGYHLRRAKELMPDPGFAERIARLTPWVRELAA